MNKLYLLAALAYATNGSNTYLGDCIDLYSTDLAWTAYTSKTTIAKADASYTYYADVAITNDGTATIQYCDHDALYDFSIVDTTASFVTLIYSWDMSGTPGSCAEDATTE